MLADLHDLDIMQNTQLSWSVTSLPDGKKPGYGLRVAVHKIQARKPHIKHLPSVL